MRETMDKGKGIMQKQHDIADRSKIRILLCDVNAESCQEILSLLCKCSYQVAAVWTNREVINAVNSKGPNAHIILAEVGLLMANDGLLLRHIMHEKQLQRTPVIIVTTRDEVTTTMKGLKLGATDYLVKPLQNNELLNLWMHLEK